VNRGHGLGREDLAQRLQTFWEMSKKTIVEFSRYPIAFVALFAQIFLIILMFLFAAIAFTDPLTEMEVTLPATTEGAATLDWLNQTTTVLGVDYGSFTVVHLRAEPAVVQSIQARSLEARELNAGLGQQIAGPHDRSNFYGHAEDLPRSLGLDLDQVDGLDGSGRLDCHREIPALHGGEGHRRQTLLLGAEQTAREEDRADRDDQGNDEYRVPAH